MRRTGVTIHANTQSDLPDHLKSNYKKIVYTGNTIKRPYGCSTPKCSFCTKKSKNWKHRKTQDDIHVMLL